MSTTFFLTNPECEIVTTRIFPVNQSTLFKAFSDPGRLAQWWGPAGFTNTFSEFDFREGGKWNFIMHGPEQGNYQNSIEFVKISEPELIAWKRHSKPLFNVEFSFEKLDENNSKLIFRMIFDTEDECNKMKKFVVDKNEENFDKLEEVLSVMEKG